MEPQVGRRPGRFGRWAVLLATAPLLLAATGCGKDHEAEPPPPGAMLCGAAKASWWFDATGADDLSGELKGSRLPLKNPDQSRTSTTQADCEVYSGLKRVGWFRAELTTADEVINSAMSIAERPAKQRFTAAGGKGSADPNPNDDGAEAWWTCKSTLLSVHLTRPKDVEKRTELARTLGARVAGVVGCPGPVPKLPSD